MYRGGIGQWSWILHRVTGVGILLFLIIHVMDTALIMWGPDMYNHVLALYRHPLFRPMEIFLFGAVLFHALNGLRVIIIDLWSQGSRVWRGHWTSLRAPGSGGQNPPCPQSGEATNA